MLKLYLYNHTKKVVEFIANTTQEYLGPLKKHHKDSYKHSMRVCILCAQIDYKLGLDTPKRLSFNYAGALHDIGKVGVPVEILSKNGPLSYEEGRVVRKHATYSIGFLRYFPDPEVMKISAYHHEFKKNDPYRRNWQNALAQNHDRTFNEKRFIFGQLLAIADTIDRIVNPIYPKTQPSSKQEVVDGVMSDFVGERRLVEQVVNACFQ